MSKAKEITTIVATVDLGNVSANVIEAAFERVLAEHGVTLVMPCGWAPDPDTIAECVDLENVEVDVVDMNAEEWVKKLHRQRRVLPST